MTQETPMLNALIDRCCRWINVLIALALAVMVVMVFGNVVLRYAFNSGIAVSEEVSRWLFVWITFLGAIVAVKEHGHLGTDLVLTKLPPIAQRVCLVISHGLMLFCTWLLFSGALSQARINWDVEAPVTGASVAIFYASGVVFAVASGLLLLLNLWRLLSGQGPDDQLGQTSGAGDVGSLLAAMAIGVPIAYALLVSGVALMWHLDLFDAQILAQNVINGADSFPLLAVPFFMLAGEIMNAGGLSQRIVKLALTLVGHKRGGLGFVAILAACMLAALSGSAGADTAALAALLLPMMVKAGHDKARAGGLIASAGIIAPVIPPSIGFVVFGVAANVSISKLFLAGIVPGLLMGLSIAAAWYWVSQRESILPPPRATTAEKLQALKESTWAL